MIATKGARELPNIPRGPVATSDVCAAVYSRVSSDEQVLGTSLDDQQLRGVGEAERRGLRVAGIFRDEGATGTTADRPEWNRLMSACRAGEIQAVIATKWDRIARSAQVGLEIAATLEELGVRLIVIEADFDTSTPTGKMLRHMLVGFAALERDTIVERMGRGQRSMASKGFWPSGGASPYGYRATGGRDNRLAVYEPEAAVVRSMVSMILERGLTTGQVAQHLNAEGEPTRWGKQWNHQHLRRMLTERTLLGEFIWANTEKTHRSYVPSGKYGPGIPLKYEPLISAVEFDALQLALSRRAHGANRPRKTYPLSGRLTCSCGEPFGGTFRADRDLRQYICKASKWQASSLPRCRARRIEADWIERRVWAEITELLGQPERLLSLVSDYVGLRTVQVGAERDEGGRIEANLSRLERALKRARKDALLSDDPESYREIVEELAADVVATRQQQQMLLQWRKDSTEAAKRAQDVWTLAESAAIRLPDMNLEQRAEVLALLDVRVTVLDQPPDAPARGGANGGYGVWRPRVRIEGSVPHASLLDTLDGNHAVAGIPLASLRRR
jgi:site-specific DNA recombinase